ncbi:hypothetical protein Ava_0907 [Trichormus variabilis ATCC 29413]|uniref:Uncharacterized protein n=2 Tax=Anabaena variabilis TaxID=264691 RepID=Q3MEQ5_TRIV2|nr:MULTISPECIES: hypothetical protein [Nostocaceae]ABA20531.1 hypothetical protein Ava_0907 [Trichormus variabilis ATCC 29413]MBC1216995.1 hypothetical protein [Trichormus variabilis ARAD]MBC1258719.1 hypothetical protein [Trichormus variabilis V5]MBC1267029.1 hypothetical protein [Trichormus variabilis FSR]MBC1300825.1 hypothetical protein [Trichormus variabilis N2B]
MTELLQRVIAEIEKLPLEEENWRIRFQSTTDYQWDSLAEMVRQEIASGEIIPFFDKLRSTQVSNYC